MGAPIELLGVQKRAVGVRVPNLSHLDPALWST